MNATAISNNDMVYLNWHFSKKIEGCLGFSVLRHATKDDAGTPLPAMVGFPGDRPDAGKRFRDTDEWPIQKFAWKDLFAKRGGTYWYEIVPMIGTPGNLKPDRSLAMRTNTVTVDERRGACSVFFNRGIISTQAIARELPKAKSGLPDVNALKAAIRKPGSDLRKRLVGDLERGVLALLKRAEAEGGACYCALYELSDPTLVKRLCDLGTKVHVVLSNAGEDTQEGSGDGDSTNQEARKKLEEKGIDVTHRMLAKGHIGHNKFVVYVKGGVARAVLCGSTNWTPTGLCAQSNNAIIVESEDVAGDYWTYWKRLKKDTTAAGEDPKALQDAKLRTADGKPNPVRELEPGEVRAWFSPNTPQKSVPKNKVTPPDLAEVFELIEGAKQGALFLAFIPGNPSVVSKLKEVYDARRKEQQLFYLRGAATSPDPADVFRVDLYHRSSVSDASVLPVTDRPALRVAEADASAVSVAGIFAAFAAWEAEIYKVGHAVIHDKILVIDPFTDHSVVVTGSHNLGFKASYANDENLLVIRDDRAVAEAYAAHVLDVYEHYRWRWRLQQPIRDAYDALRAQHPDAQAGELWRQAVKQVGSKVLQEAWRNLATTDAWQDFYAKNQGFLAAENNFWSSFGGVGLSDGIPQDPARARPRRRTRRTAG
jgi:phosphatidylserine/phosphatidylglycerophosphate/cardiolipin synthase-like enzyme